MFEHLEGEKYCCIDVIITANEISIPLKMKSLTD